MATKNSTIPLYKKILAGFFFIICFVAFFFIYDIPYRGSFEQSSTIKVFAHRGFGNYAPDNSLEGAVIALSYGLDGVDVDAQLTKDKEVIIFHDVSIERFTAGEGRVDSKTLKELQTYDLATKYGADFSSVYIKTFEDFVKNIASTSLLMVELKVASPKNTGIEEKVNEVISKYNAYDKVYISSFNPVVLYRLKKINPSIKTVFIFKDSGWDEKRVLETKQEDRVTLPWYLQKEITRTLIRNVISPDALSIHHEVNERTIRKLINKGYPVFIWPTNDEASIKKSLSSQPYGLVTDEPLLSKKLRDELK